MEVVPKKPLKIKCFHTKWYLVRQDLLVLQLPVCLVSIVTKRFVRHWWSPEPAKSGIRSTISVLRLSGLLQNLDYVDGNTPKKRWTTLLFQQLCNIILDYQECCLQTSNSCKQLMRNVNALCLPTVRNKYDQICWLGLYGSILPEIEECCSDCIPVWHYLAL